MLDLGPGGKEEVKQVTRADDMEETDGRGQEQTGTGHTTRKERLGDRDGKVMEGDGAGRGQEGVKRNR